MTEVVDDFYLPAQVPSSHKDQPARKLWLAVLNRARMDLAGHGALGTGQHHGRLSGPRSALTAAKWFAADTDQPGDFVWVCTVLGIQPDAIRASLPPVPERCHDVIRTAPLRYRLEWGV